MLATSPVGQPASRVGVENGDAGECPDLCVWGIAEEPLCRARKAKPTDVREASLKKTVLLPKPIITLTNESDRFSLTTIRRTSAGPRGRTPSLAHDPIGVSYRSPA